MKCRICGEEFTPSKNHPGYINVCVEPECRAAAKEPKPKVMTVGASALVTFDDEIEI